MKFEKISDNIAAITEALKDKTDRICDNTPMDLYAWAPFFDTEAAVCDDFVLFKKRLGGNTYISVATGGDFTSAAKAALDCGCDGLCYVTEENLDAARSLFKSCVTIEQTAFADYLYGYDDLAYLKGKKYNGQRNHVNKFKKLYGIDYRPIDENNIEEILTFLEAFDKGLSGYAAAELRTVRRLMDRLFSFDYRAGALYVGGKVAAFAAGEVVGDTLYTHVEKADRSVEGGYAAINEAFALANGGVRFINREEDMGDAGLRYAKTSYHPVALIKKYVVKENR